ncbi:MAG: hypothetical protein PHS37_00835 [Candidatus Omnitrophica bacterium]|nr:hypothetical protein [Candidatus Omnitrophota bacterium]
MAKTNYSYIKFKKEQARKKKKEAKMQRKLERKNMAPQDSTGPELVPGADVALTSTNKGE